MFNDPLLPMVRGLDTIFHGLADTSRRQNPHENNQGSRGGWFRGGRRDEQTGGGLHPRNAGPRDRIETLNEYAAISFCFCLPITLYCFGRALLIPLLFFAIASSTSFEQTLEEAINKEKAASELWLDRTLLRSCRAYSTLTETAMPHTRRKNLTALSRS